MRKLLSMLTFCVSICLVSAQENFTISGYITDYESGETLIGATALVKELGNGAVSNEYGFYSISVPEGSYTLEFSYIGFDNIIKSVSLSANYKLDIELGEMKNELAEVVVTAKEEDSNVREVSMSVNKLDITTIKSMPTLLGEVEIIRSLQLLPGVNSVGEGATGFNVRGGSIDQNLILLDEAPVYNSSHLFGFFSVFNPDAVKDVKLYKGGIPSRYGGRLSSILDVRMKEGNKKKLNINGGVGFIFSRLSVEAPIIKDKSSLIVAARRSYIDVLAKPFLSESLNGSELNFYDLTLKTNYDINDKNRLFISGYFGRDNFGFGDQAGFNWGNKTGTIRWNHLFSERLFSNLTFYFSDYDYQIKFGNDSQNKFDWNASIQNIGVKPEFSFFLKPGNLLKFGGQSILYTFDPGNAVGVSEGEERDFSLPQKYAMENAVYVENEIDITTTIKANYGLRLSSFTYLGKGTAYEYTDGIPGERRYATSATEYDDWESIKTYYNFEPRLSLQMQLSSNNSIKASYNRTTQYIHLVSNTTAATPVDVWTPSTNNIRPSTADQVAFGYFQNLNDNTYELSAEVYYKTMNNLVDYIDGADLLLNQFIEGDLIEGEGRAYGIELMAKKTKGKFNGWLSYTLARTERQTPGINGGEWYASRFDQLHNLSLTGFYEINDRWTTSANFAFNTGSPTTFPTTRYTIQGFVVPHNANEVRNNVRLPNYHRLDLSITRKGKIKEGKRWTGDWVFSVYNVYNRKNAFSIFFAQEDGRIPIGSSVNTDAYRLSVIGNFIPSVSYNFKFN
ncbi:TonB-dependent receptor [Saprospiraceae bacterium]|nr:TonB-dependent receptor [Saprospiraceae bacterium]MDB4162463.1 TonB-dependent receptor [Saprospiraceae bacterium]MDB4824270.1 TonB-dependent receptor [Saprospiraceae bacterium]